jgi:hypothetical protein
MPLIDADSLTLAMYVLVIVPIAWVFVLSAILAVVDLVRGEE